MGRIGCICVDETKNILESAAEVGDCLCGIGTTAIGVTDEEGESSLPIDDCKFTLRELTCKIEI